VRETRSCISYYDSTEGHDPVAAERLGQAVAVASGGHDVSMVKKPIDGGCGQRLRHDFVEP
jgi:hypothetical protein